MVGKAIESFINDEQMNIMEFIIQLDKPLLREVTETIESVDETYMNSGYRLRDMLLSGPMTLTRL